MFSYLIVEYLYFCLASLMYNVVNLLILFQPNIFATLIRKCRLKKYKIHVNI
jgi:hypothetical protein